MATTESVKVDIESPAEENETKDSKSEANKKEKEKKEDVPNLGGQKAVVKLYGKSLGGWWFLGTIVALANGCVMPLFGVLFREIINSLFLSDNIVKDSLQVCIWYVVVGVSAAILTIGQYSIWGYYGEKIGSQFRKDYFELLLNQEVGYHDISNSGTLNTKLISEGTAVAAGSGVKMGFFLQNVGTIVLGFTLAFLYSWEMTLVLLACVPVLTLVGILQTRMFSGNNGQNVDPFVKAGSFSNEVLINIKTVIAMPKLTKSKIIEYGKELSLAYPISKKRALSMGVGIGGMLFGMFGVVYAIGLWYGSRLVDDGTIDIGDMFGCYFSFLMAGMGIGQLGSVANDLKAADMAANIFLNLRAREPKIKPCDFDSPINPSDNLKNGDISFENVSFAYPASKDKIVLNNVSFSAKSGQTVALVGPSGSGKSTIINLLERYYDPLIGNIKIDGNLIHNYDINYLRSQIGYVSQMPLLFDASILENIRGGNSNVTDEMIYEAAKQADADEFILKLPQKYDTKVGEMGGRLSGGQRQRICIARAIVSKPKILLLDEATSALDTKSEREVQKAIDKISLTGGKTIIVIAHRLSTIKNADLICVLVEGEIDEMGTHNELMSKGGVYAVLCRSQALVEKHRKQSDPLAYSNGNDDGNNDNNDNNNDGMNATGTKGNTATEENEEQDNGETNNGNNASDDAPPAYQDGPNKDDNNDNNDNNENGNNENENDDSNNKNENEYMD